MIIFKLFGSIILLLMFLGLIFVVFGLFIAQSFMSDLGKFFSKNDNDELNDSFNSNTKKRNSEKVHTIYECPKCGTYYAEMPEDGKCSCGAKLK